jgi:hypothetical protein
MLRKVYADDPKILVHQESFGLATTESVIHAMKKVQPDLKFFGIMGADRTESGAAEALAKVTNVIKPESDQVDAWLVSTRGCWTTPRSTSRPRTS